MSQNGENAEKAEARGRVLVIDDEADIRAAFKIVLTDAGFTVITAADGPEGIRKNTESDPDVIILDLKMPGMGGVEALREIRKTDQAVQVLILTGYGDAASIRAAVDLNVYEYVSKPFRNAMIIGAVREALDEGGDGGGRGTRPTIE